MSQNILTMIVLIQAFVAGLSLLLLKNMTLPSTDREASKNPMYLFFGWLLVISFYPIFITVPLLIISHFTN